MSTLILSRVTQKELLKANFGIFFLAGNGLCDLEYKLRYIDDQFCDDINRLIYEEDMLMNSGSRDESQSEDLDLNPNMLIRDHRDPKPDEPPIALLVLGRKQRVYDLKKKKQQVYERYTCEQVKRMLEVFDKNPHPTEKERRALARELELRHSQIKFWFQNHRSQTKKKHEKEENAKLREENEKLRADNEAMTISLNAARCNPCSCLVPGETSARRAEFLKAENDFLKEELSRVNNFLETCGNGKKPLAEAAGRRMSSLLPLLSGCQISNLLPSEKCLEWHGMALLRMMRSKMGKE